MGKDHPNNCCDEKAIAPVPDHTKELHRISRILGQLEGIKRMVSKREYCPKIITQVQAVRAALKALESALLKKHLEACVRDAFSARSPREKDKKIEELVEIMRRD